MAKNMDEIDVFTKHDGKTLDPVRNRISRRLSRRETTGNDCMSTTTLMTRSEIVDKYDVDPEPGKEDEVKTPDVNEAIGLIKESIKDIESDNDDGKPIVPEVSDDYDLPSDEIAGVSVKGVQDAPYRPLETDDTPESSR